MDGLNGQSTALHNNDEEFKNGSTARIIEPYVVECSVEGVAATLFHRWDCSDVEDKANSTKGSKKKKSDNVEAYVYRCQDGTLGIPAANVKSTIINAARWSQDPRSPRKSAMDLFKAGIFITPTIATFGKKTWDFLDKRRVTIQRAGITRIRPALLEGWKVKFEIHVIQPEYIAPSFLYEVISRAGSLVGFCDFRPEYGRFQINNWKVLG